METATLAIARLSGDPTAYWRPENVAVTKSDMTFERIELQARTLAAICVTSIELLEDAANLDPTITNALAQALALEMDRAALRGIGAASEPLGIRNWPGVNLKDMGVNGGILDGYDDFMDAIQLLLGGQRRAGRGHLRAQDGGRPGEEEGRPGSPAGRPQAYTDIRTKLVSKQVPINLTKGTANNASEAYVGDFSKLLVGMRTELMIEASRAAGDGTDNAFQQLQVWIRAYLRADVAVERDGAFCVIDGIIPG